MSLVILGLILLCFYNVKGMVTRQLVASSVTHEADSSGCGGEVWLDEGNLTSPGFPYGIPFIFTECTWILKTEFTSRVRLRFVTTDLPVRSRRGLCNVAYVMFGGFDVVGRKVIHERYCGCETPDDFISKNNWAWVTFLSSGDKMLFDYAGFQVHYKMVMSKMFENQMIVGFTCGLMLPIACCVPIVCYVKKVRRKRERVRHEARDLQYLKYEHKQRQREAFQNRSCPARLSLRRKLLMRSVKTNAVKEVTFGQGHFYEEIPAHVRDTSVMDSTYLQPVDSGPRRPSLNLLQSVMKKLRGFGNRSSSDDDYTKTPVKPLTSAFREARGSITSWDSLFEENPTEDQEDTSNVCSTPRPRKPESSQGVEYRNKLSTSPRLNILHRVSLASISELDETIEDDDDEQCVPKTLDMLIEVESQTGSDESAADQSADTSGATRVSADVHIYDIPMIDENEKTEQIECGIVTDSGDRKENYYRTSSLDDLMSTCTVHRSLCDLQSRDQPDFYDLQLEQSLQELLDQSDVRSSDSGRMYNPTSSDISRELATGDYSFEKRLSLVKGGLGENGRQGDQVVAGEQDNQIVSCDHCDQIVMSDCDVRNSWEYIESDSVFL